MQIHEVRFRVEGRPVPKERPRFGGGSVRTPQKTKDAEQAIAEQAALVWRRQPSLAEFGLECAFVLPTRHTVDIDNLVKTVMDALNGVVWKDDDQVIELKAKKHYTTEHAGYTVVALHQIGDT